MAFKKILAIKLRSMGDTVLMTAPLLQLRKAYPSAQIDVVVLSQWAPLLVGHTAIDRIWRYDRYPDRASRAKATTRIALKLRQERYDCVVNFHASPSSSIIAFATGAKTRAIHFHGHKDKNRYSTVTVPGKGTLKPVIERDMDTIRALGLSIPEGRLPILQPTEAETRWAKLYVDTIAQGQPIIAIGLGASRPTKSWSLQNFATFAIDWSQKQKAPIVVLVSQFEAKLGVEFLDLIEKNLEKSIADPAERAVIKKRITVESLLTVREVSALLGAVSLFVGNDSGPKHLAIANGTPTVTLFGPEHPFEWHPYPIDKNPYFFIENLECRKDAQPGMPPWCGLDVCIIEKHKCMTQIGVPEVMTKCLELLK